MGGIPIKRVHTPVYPSPDLQLGTRYCYVLGRVLVDTQVDHRSRCCANEGPTVKVMWIHGCIYRPKH